MIQDKFHEINIIIITFLIPIFLNIITLEIF